MTSTIAFDVIARDKASGTFSKIGQSSEKAKKKVLGFAKSTTGLIGFTSLTAAAAGFIRVGADYSTSLNKIQALSGLTDKQLAKVGSTLESQSGAFAKMGQTTGDAASGMVELVKAGLSANSALQAVRQTMVLAKAGELSVADASSLVANTMHTFGLKASQAGVIANYLANAANISSANVSDLAESMKYVAPVAAATGVSLKQVNAILAELSNSGISASNAGTGFRKFLLSLQSPAGKAKKDLQALGVTIFDSQGKMKPLGTVIDILGSKLNKLTDQKRQKVLKDVFGLQGISSATVILKGGSKGLETYSKGVSQAGAAARLANAQSKGFAGTLRTLRAEVISSAQAEYRHLEPSLNAAAKSLQRFLEQMRTGKGVGGDFVSVLKDLAGAAKATVQFVSSIPGPVKKLGVEALIAYYALNKFSGAFSGLGGRVTGSVASMKQFRAELSYSETRMGALTRVTSGFGGVAKQVAGVGGMLLLADSAHRSSQSMKFFESVTGAALTGLSVGGAPGAFFGAAAGAVLSLATATHKAAVVTVTAADATRHYVAALRGLSNIHSEEARAEALKTLNKQYAYALPIAEKLKISQRDLVGIITNEKGARERVLAIANKASHSQYESVRNAGNATKVFVDFLGQERSRLEGVVQANHKHNQTVATLKTLVSKLPKAVQTEIKQPGLIKSVADIRALYKQYHLTPTQIQTVIEATGVKATVSDIQKVINKAKEASRTTAKPKVELSGFQKAILQIEAVIRKIQAANHAGTSGGARGGLTSSGSKSSSKSSTTWMSGLKAPSVVPPWQGGSAPRVAAQKSGEKTGAAYITGLIKSIDNRHIEVKTAMDRLKNVIATVSNRIGTLKALKSQFKSTFTADSVFGADISTSGSLQGLMQFQSDQAAKAAQLLADVQSVRAKGLSNSLLKQLQSQGSAGADQLHLLASASADQIKMLNAQNAATQASLQAAGMFVGNSIRGGSVDASIARAEKQNHLLYEMLHELRQMNGGTVVEIGPDAIIRVIKRYAKSKGTTPAKLLATSG